MYDHSGVYEYSAMMQVGNVGVLLPDIQMNWLE